MRIAAILAFLLVVGCQAQPIAVAASKAEVKEPPKVVARQEPKQQSPHLVPGANIPRESRRWFKMALGEHRKQFGHTRFLAAWAAQIDQESNWKTLAKSHVGARGMAQFMPATAKWAGETFAKDLGVPDSLSPAWSVKASIRYDARLYRMRIKEFANPCDAFSATLCDYNGGRGNLNKERRLCGTTVGCDKTLYWGHVENIRKRANWAFKENRGYPIAILRKRQRKFLDAGYGRVTTCARA